MGLKEDDPGTGNTHVSPAFGPSAGRAGDEAAMVPWGHGAVDHSKDKALSER